MVWWRGTLQQWCQAALLTPALGGLGLGGVQGDLSLIRRDGGRAGGSQQEAGGRAGQQPGES